jgi:ABC-2 type transport system permease protein
MSRFSSKRLFAFMYKETLQAYRDPSTLIIAVILPAIMIFLFAYGVSLDTNTVKIGLVLEDTSQKAQSLAHAFENTRFFNVKVRFDRKELTQELVEGIIRGIVIIPQDFSDKIERNLPSPIQVIADGSETNTASFVQNYADGVVATWRLRLQQEQGAMQSSSILTQPRVWFNPELKSRNVLLPGSIAIVMALIGILLTALVVAREWERGTMEAIMATPIHIVELIIGKMTPYFFLGMGSMILCVALSILIFDVPFNGSFLILALGTALFLLAGLAQGLLISTLAKNQFVASQIAMMAAFLPSFMLSGFLYEIESMPASIRWVTYLLPAKYFVTIIQTSFLAGVVWSLFIFNMLAMLSIAIVLLFFVTKKSKKALL